MLPAPEVAHRIHDLVATAADDGVVRVTQVGRILQGCRDRIALFDRTFEHQVDGCRDQFHVAKLFRGDGCDEVIERFKLLLFLEAE